MKKILNKTLNVWPFKSIRWKYIRMKDSARIRKQMRVSKKDNTFGEVKRSTVPKNKKAKLTKREEGQKELDTLRIMFERWVRSDFNWAIDIVEKQGRSRAEDEWEFLKREWIDKLENYLAPYVHRLHKTEHITENELKEFGAHCASVIETMNKALYLLGGKEENE